MPMDVRLYRVLIASPSDVTAERDAIRAQVHSWTGINAAHYGVALVPVGWESHVSPEMGSSAQSIINKQIVDDCDILVGVFWTRIGTQTETAESGTAEEIRRFVAAGKRVMLYFSKQPVRPDSIDAKQYARLKEFQNWCRDNGVYFEITDSEDLRQQLDHHLTLWARGVTGTANPGPDRVLAADDLRAAFRAIDAEWRGIRDSDRPPTEEGKDVLARLGALLANLRAAAEDSNPETTAQLDAAIRDIRTLRRHTVYLDGGHSYDAFWTDGTSVLNNSREAIAALQVPSWRAIQVTNRVGLAPAVETPVAFFRADIRSKQIPQGLAFAGSLANVGRGLAHAPYLYLGGFNSVQTPNVVASGEAITLEIPYEKTEFYAAPMEIRHAFIEFDDELGSRYVQHGEIAIHASPSGVIYFYELTALTRPERVHNTKQNRPI